RVGTVQSKNNELIDLCAAKLAENDHEAAFDLLCARANFLRASTNPCASLFFLDEVFLRLSFFPERFGTAFLEKYSLPWTAYPSLARTMTSWRQVPDSELRNIFEAGISRYPAEGGLFKDIVLFWRRRKTMNWQRIFVRSQLPGE
ncbi:MAG: hypothetical protein HC904_17750, partial [Blastochloris sp.]|nr:hypothetical protein [Blastochloris sp.]